MSDSAAKIEAFMKRVYAAADVALTVAGAILADTMVKSLGNRGGHGERSAPGAPPNIQKGELSRSLGYSEAKGMRSIVGAGVFYAKVLEFGKVIRAKKKAMLIPLSRLAQNAYNATSNGRSALIWYEMKVGKKNIVQIKRPGHVLIGHKVGGKSARIEFDFMLTASVQIKPRPFMRPSLAKAKPAMQSAFCSRFREQMGVR